MCGWRLETVASRCYIIRSISMNESLLLVLKDLLSDYDPAIQSTTQLTIGHKAFGHHYSVEVFLRINDGNIEIVQNGYFTGVKYDKILVPLCDPSCLNTICDLIRRIKDFGPVIQ